MNQDCSDHPLLYGWFTCDCDWQPGCVNTTEMDIKKCRRLKNPLRVKKVCLCSCYLCVCCSMRPRGCLIVLWPVSVSVLQSVYGVVDDTQIQSPVHTPSQQSSKNTREGVEKEVCASNGVKLILDSLTAAIKISHDQVEMQWATVFCLFQILFLNTQLDRHCMKMSKVAET